MILPFGLTKLRLGIYAGALVVMSCLFLWARHETARAGALSDRVSALARDVDTAHTSNEAQVTVIDKLKAANKVCTSHLTPDDEMRRRADAAAKFEAELKRTREELDRLAREKDYGNPDCQRLLAMDFQQLCPALAARVRARASGVRETSAGRGSGVHRQEDRPGSPEGVRSAVRFPAGHASNLGSQ